MISLFAAQMAFPQGPDAMDLLRSVAERATSTKSWRVEGTVEDSNSPGVIASFTFLQLNPDRSRFEQMAGLTPALVLCDGQTRYTYSTPLNQYSEDRQEKDTDCSSIVQDWAQLPNTLQSPRVTGEGTYTAPDRTLACTIIRASSRAELASAGTVNHTLCVDSNRGVVGWARMETKHSKRSYSYTAIDADPLLDAGAFVFHAPADSKLSHFQLPVTRPLGHPSFDRPGVTGPFLKSRRDPNYDDASRRARIQGTVVLYVVIDERGVPAEVEVYRPLSPGLNANALSAVRRWRFESARKNGQPIASPALIEINYKLAP